MRARVQRLDKLERKLKAMPRAVREAMRGALRQNADELTAMQKRLVPVDDGVLRDSIEWNWSGNGGPDLPTGALSSPVSSSAALKGQFDLAITVTAGSREAYYARFVEFGTQAGVFGARVSDTRSGSTSATRKSYRTHGGTTAQPFFYPAFRALRKRMKSRVTRAQNKAIKEIAAR